MNVEQLTAAEQLRADFARKVKECEAQLRHAKKALALAEARMEAANEIVAAMRRQTNP